MPTGVYPRTPEMNQNMSVALSGRLITEEHRANISASKIGSRANEEARAKMSATHIANWQNLEFYNKQVARRQDPEYQAKISVANTGKRRTDEAKAKMRIANAGERNGFYGRCHTEESKAKMRAASTGVILSEETKAKIGATGIGRHPTIETRKKLSIGKIGILNPMFKHYGELNPSWKGGLSNEPYPLSFNEQLKETIRIRDNRTCQLCGVPEVDCLTNLAIHHIDYNRQNILPMNLISLCIACNSRVNAERAYYQMFFSAKIKEIYRCHCGL